MEIDIDDIDFDRLRKDIIDYFGPATPYFLGAKADVVYNDTCEKLELLNIINETDLDIMDYVNNKHKYR